MENLRLRGLVGFSVFGLVGISCGIYNKDSDLSIVGGKIDNSSYPSVVSVYNGDTICTGVFIRNDIVLTAAHCLTSGGTYTIHNDHIGRQQASSKTWHPDYDTNQSTQTLTTYYVHVDLGVLKFSRPIPGVQVSPIASRAAAAGTSVKLIGYGYGSFEKKTAGDRRIGQNTIEYISARDGSYVLKGVKYDTQTGNGMGASAMQGDSGSPLFNANNEILGILSGNNTDPSDHTLSFYANLSENQARAWVAQQLDSQAPPAGNSNPINNNPINNNPVNNRPSNNNFPNDFNHNNLAESIRAQHCQQLISMGVCPSSNPNDITCKNICGPQ